MLDTLISLGLTKTEIQLALRLIASTGKVVTRETLLEDVWGLSPKVIDRIQTRTVDMTVARLRKKLEDLYTVQTVRGFGYKIVTK